MEKFREQSFTPLFEDSAPDLRAHLLISSPSSTVLRAAPIYLPDLSTANRFSICLLIPPCLCISVFRRYGGGPREERFLKRPKDRGIVFRAFFFGPPARSSSASAALFHFASYPFLGPRLSLIWMGGSFRSMKFGSRPRGNLWRRKLCLSFPFRPPPRSPR